MKYMLANMFCKIFYLKLQECVLYMLFLDKEKTNSIAFLKKKCTKTIYLRYVRVQESKVKDK